MVLQLPSALLFVGVSLFLSNDVVACEPHPAHRHLAPRVPQATISTSSRTQTQPPSLASTHTSRPAVTRVPSGGFPLSNLGNIKSTPSVEPAIPLPTYTPGTPSPVNGAPPLPAIDALNPALYPALDRRPALDSPEVKQWLSQIDLANAPAIPLKGVNGCSNTTYNAQARAKAGQDGDCWWTCGGCTRPTDVTMCPTKDTWGMSYDDGPSPYTPRLLKLLEERDLKSTFFVVGSRAISYPATLQAEYMAAHQISVHTWSHPPLTELTNEEIVAELGWTRKVIQDITGVSPNTMRPPYGDIDDRVRYIAHQMNLLPIIWTSVGSENFDTQDWRIATGESPQAVYEKFEDVLSKANTMLTSGFIVLAHDLYQQSVDLAVNFVLPRVLADSVLKIQAISTCLGMDLSQVYVETATNSSLISSPSSSLSTTSSKSEVQESSPTSRSTSGSLSPSSTTTSGAATLASFHRAWECQYLSLLVVVLLLQ